MGCNFSRIFPLSDPENVAWSSVRDNHIKALAAIQQGALLQTIINMLLIMLNQLHLNEFLLSSQTKSIFTFSRSPEYCTDVHFQFPSNFDMAKTRGLQCFCDPAFS